MTRTLRNLPAENIARWVFIVLLGLAVVIFGAFFLVGFDRPYADDPNFNAPLLTDVVMVFVVLLVLLALVATGWAAVRTWRQRDRADDENGVPAKCIAWGVAGGTVLLLAVTFLLASTDPILVNNTTYDNHFWLRTADMFVWSSAFLIIAAVTAVCLYTFRDRSRH